MQPTADEPSGNGPNGIGPSRGRWLGELIDRHGASLALYAAQWTTAADDCVQEALVALAAQQPLPDQPVAWLYAVVRRRAMNQARSDRRRYANEQQAWQHRLQSRTRLSESPELLDAVAQLPDELRELVVLKIWGGLTFDEAAEVLGAGASTLHRRYHEALDRLRQVWEIPCEKTTKSE
jgi:RNA polymerase sigma factor (sigma-70 family)